MKLLNTRSIGGIIFACVIIITSLLAGCTQATNVPSATPAQTQSVIGFETLIPAAKTFVDQMVQGDFTKATSTFDQAMLNAMPEAKLKDTWQQLLGQVGAYQAQLGTWTEEVQGYKAVNVTTQFEKSIIDIRVVFNSQGQISGLQFKPGKAPSATQPTETDLTQKAQAFVDEMAKGDFAAAYARFDAQMKAAITEAKLKDIWQQLIGQSGAYQKQVAATPNTVQGYQAVYVTVQFEKDQLDIRVIFDAQGLVAGMQMLPPNSAITTPQVYSSPTYVNQGAFTNTAVTVGSGEWSLPGTLNIPVGKGPFPAVVLVHGSGPNDRDETIGPNKPFKDLAEGLASQGIAVLRYDKRTYAHKNLFTPEIIAKLTLNEETVDDALLAVQLLRQTQGIDTARIIVAGHSLGAQAAPRIGQRDPQLAGLILLAGPSRPLEDVILNQYQDQYGPQADQTNSMATQVARVKDPALTADTPSNTLPLNITAAYWLDLRDYHQVEVAKSLSMPMLILQGGRDFQVLADKDFTGWKTGLAGKNNATFKLYPALSHLFIAGEGPATATEYDKAGNVAAEVVSDIAQWVKSN